MARAEQLDDLQTEIGQSSGFQGLRIEVALGGCQFANARVFRVLYIHLMSSSFSRMQWHFDLGSLDQILRCTPSCIIAVARQANAINAIV
jgi:hypothetical protein